MRRMRPAIPSVVGSGQMDRRRSTCRPTWIDTPNQSSPRPHRGSEQLWRPGHEEDAQGTIDKQASQEAYSRPWTCPDCARVTRVTYEELAEVGSPICPDCDIEMVLV